MRFESENPIFESDNLKQQIKIERTKKKGEKLASCSLIIFLFSLKRLPPLVKEALFQ